MAKANFSELHTNSKDQGQKFSYWKEGLVTRNTLVKYEIFEKWVKLQGQGEEVKFGGTLREDLVTRNTPVKYETHIPTHAKVIDKVKVLADRRTDGRPRHNKKYIPWKLCL